MATAHRRESMIALRATHQAFRICCDLAYEPIDVNELACDACGSALAGEPVWHDYSIRCPSCGRITELPLHLRSSYLLPDQSPAGPFVRRRKTPGEWVAVALMGCVVIAALAMMVLAFIYG